MTQEEKQLLLVDLCARLTYGVKFLRESWNCEWEQKMSVIEVLEDIDKDGYVITIVSNVKGIKPYLRPMSSMTEDEREEYISTFEKDVFGKPTNIKSIKTFDWLNKKMFDYRGLISMGLALEAPEGMYNE